MKIIKKKVYRHAGKTYVDIKLEVDESQWHEKEEMQARLDRSLPWMADHLTNWADFDYSYTLNVFIDSLYALGQGLIRWDNASNAQRNGRRAMTAARMLKKAYNYETYLDKSYINWSKRSIDKTRPYKGHKGMIEMFAEHPYDNAMGMEPLLYSSKMLKIIFNRQRKTESNMKKDAWNYVNKYICTFWD